MKVRSVLIELIPAFFVFLFVYTAFSKLLALNIFTLTLEETPLISNIAPYIAISIPLIELVAATLLLIPRTRKWGLCSAFVLMMAFTLYIGYMLLFTPDRPCTCGGVLEKMTWTQHLLFNIVCTCLALTGILLSPVNK